MERVCKSFKRIFVKIILLSLSILGLIFTNFTKKLIVNSVINITSGEIWQNNKPVLCDINVDIKETELVYIIGKTGAGKSSFLKALYGELTLKKGVGTISGFNLNKLKKRNIPNLRRSLGIVFQDFQLLTDRSVLSNLLFVMGASGWKNRSLMKKRAEEVLSLVGLKNKTNTMPFALSGGEQQRVSIARALLNKPKLILADEPTGNLDPETSEEIMQLLIAVSKEQNAAILMATHDLSIIKAFPGRLLSVQEGTIKELSEVK
ncbi:MAG: phosphonate ABC transporter ATP-binding protein [Crocinitomicaceae bacterium]|nr:phosphonate ABC transporter ATP-binding protein [Crocinitomicaceae bacterium]|tara:strand:+ start:24956 stop:25741 length:786 start_codon:yes stop_codon:yes gene_type:complete